MNHLGRSVDPASFTSSSSSADADLTTTTTTISSSTSCLYNPLCCVPTPLHPTTENGSSDPQPPPPKICTQAPIGLDCCCCKRCLVGGCDLKVLDCGCCLHTRCCPVSPKDILLTCPVCHQTARALELLPMSFAEMDYAQARAAETALTEKRGKKRQNATVTRLQPHLALVEEPPCAGSGTANASGGANDVNGNNNLDTSSNTSLSTSSPPPLQHHSTAPTSANELRTGRWTPEETALCDKLISCFEEGILPLPDGIKLNDFLSSMLKSKPSRLTKKMKNAKLSIRQYRVVTGYIADDSEARELSKLESEFFGSIRCDMERSEIRFHMQREWRELFSRYCTSIGQSFEAATWLHSVEEMDRRNSLQKDAARMARRKILMGYAISQDSIQEGVFTDPAGAESCSSSASMSSLRNHQPDPVDTGNCSATAGPEAGSACCPSPAEVNRVTSTQSPCSRKRPCSDMSSCLPRNHHAAQELPTRSISSSFVDRVMNIVVRYALPFEYVDAWVPSLVVKDDMGARTPPASSVTSSPRLFFAGSSIAHVQIPAGGGTPISIPPEDSFDLTSFSLYSQNFSFDSGYGLPGRVYQSGQASWEQGIHNAPSTQFERAGGASQWGIQTAVGIPIASPNVGRIVVAFYSRFDRPRDDEMTLRLMDELNKLMPSPRWKLVIDMGVSPHQESGDPTLTSDKRELLSSIEAYMPQDKSSELSEYLPGFTAIRILLRQTDTMREHELLLVATKTYQTYKNSGHSDRDAAWMTARDFMKQYKQNLSQLKGVAPQLSSTRNTGLGYQQQSGGANCQSYGGLHFTAGPSVSSSNPCCPGGSCPEKSAPSSVKAMNVVNPNQFGYESNRDSITQTSTSGCCGGGKCNPANDSGNGYSMEHGNDITPSSLDFLMSHLQSTPTFASSSLPQGPYPSSFGNDSMASHVLSTSLPQGDATLPHQAAGLSQAQLALLLQHDASVNFQGF